MSVFLLPLMDLCITAHSSLSSSSSRSPTALPLYLLCNASLCCMCSSGTSPSSCTKYSHSQTTITGDKRACAAVIIELLVHTKVCSSSYYVKQEERYVQAYTTTVAIVCSVVLHDVIQLCLCDTILSHDHASSKRTMSCR
jgi:hypothetical protein